MHRRADAPLLSVRRRTGRISLLLLGIILPQLLLYWPSLTGRKILLPLDILVAPNVYLPAGAAPDIAPPNMILSDLVFALEPFRRFAVDEVRAGRMPLWNPSIYCGAPFLANNQSAVFSPYRILDYLIDSPIAIAWTQLVQSIVAGAGAYLFFRRALRVRIVPALIGAWCYPLTGALVFWTGFTNAAVITFLPWAMLFVDRTVRRPMGLAPIGLALATAFALVAGHSATAAHVLIAAGLFALFRVAQQRSRSTTPPPRHTTVIAPLLSLALAFAAGILLAAPQILPTLDYMRMSYRIATRLSGNDPTPVVGMTAIGQTILPYSYGTDARGGLQFFPYNIPESAASAYTGMILVLTFAPLAFAIRRRRTSAIFLLLLALVAAIPILGIPILSKPFLLFPLSALRNNRFVFVTSFCLLTLAVLGMDTLKRTASSRPPEKGPGRGDSRKATGLRVTPWISAALLTLAAAWCFYRFLYPFPNLRNVLAEASARLAAGQILASPFETPEAVERIRLWFARTYFAGFSFSVLGLLLLLRSRSTRRAHQLLWIAAAFALFELLFTAYHRIPQTDPWLYYPTLRFAQVLREKAPARSVAWVCLPSNLNMMLGQRDVRGYDAADPQRLVELLHLHSLAPRDKILRYAQLQYYACRWPSPILNMLNVRYVIGRGKPPDFFFPFYSDGDYWIHENLSALPRAFVPRSAQVVNDHDQRLALLADPQFIPRAIAYVETTGGIPPPPYEGEATMESDQPTHVILTATMRTPGLLVLSDLYDPSWRATINNTPASILPTNHALRGLILPAGQSHIDLRYQPKSFTWGLRLAGATTIIMLAYATYLIAPRRHPRVTIREEAAHG